MYGVRVNEEGKSDWVNIVCLSRVKGEQPHTPSRHEQLCYSLGRLIFCFDFFQFFLSRFTCCIVVQSREDRDAIYQRFNVYPSPCILLQGFGCGLSVFQPMRVSIFFHAKRMISKNRFREPALLGRAGIQTRSTSKKRGGADGIPFLISRSA